MRKRLIVGLILVLFVGGSFVVYKSYKQIRQARLIRQAHNYLDKNNQRRALLTLQRALNYNSNDVEAVRLMARLSEANHSPIAIYWRNRVVELNPGSVSDRLAMAQTALAFRDPASATHALEGVSDAGKKTAPYHSTAGAAAAESNQPAEAEAHFFEAARLEPQNGSFQLNLAVIHLQGSNQAARAAARVVLQKLSTTSTNSFLRCQALRELLVDSLHSREMEKAMALSTQLLENTNSIFHDRLLRLEVVQQARSNEFKSSLAGIQREAVGKTNSAEVYELATWQMANTSPAETLGWLKTVPSFIQTNPPVALIVAEAETTLQEWSALSSFLAHQNWFDLEFVRHAFHTRALRGLNSTGGAKGEWELALKAANNQKQSLAMLFGLTKQWNWQSESEDLLWIIVNNYPEESWAVKDLTRALYTSGRTRSMMLLCSQQLKRAPGRIELKRNLALLALLLNADEFRPHELAREVYEAAPANPLYATTYAYSLLVQKKSAEALQLMQKLTSSEKESPSIAGYYGLILNATGHRAEARASLDLAMKGLLLPEEQKLFQAAMNRS